MYGHFKAIKTLYFYEHVFVLCIAILIFFSPSPSYAVRIKDLTSIRGIRMNQLIGYGLVMGLNGTGDKSGTEFTVQSLVNMMEHMGIHVDKSQVKVKNIAAVIVTAKMLPFARVGSTIDVVVSSIGDAKSLVGGTLLLTPLRGVDGKVYALAQGPVSVGGFGAGDGAVKNHLLVARISRGATIEREISFLLNKKKQLMLSLYNPDFTTVCRVEKTINSQFGKIVANPLDAGTLQLTIPEKFQGNVSLFISKMELLEIVPDFRAKVVVNEKTGTVVIGEKVRLSTVAVSHGNLSIVITRAEEVSQPESFSQGKTVTTTKEEIKIEEENSKVILVPENSTIGDLVRALNAIGVTPRDLISIFQSIKAAGALQAELEII